MGYTFKLVSKKSNPNEIKEVFKVRYECYVKDKKLLPTNEDEELSDLYDDFHPSFLIYHNKKPIGTMRIEISQLGPLSEANEWNIDSSESICVFNRFAIIKEYRKQNLLPMILHFGFKTGLAEKHNLKCAYFAANSPKLINRYKKFGKVYDSNPKTINFLGLDRPGYIMLSNDLGGNRTMRRFIVKNSIKLAHCIHSIMHFSRRTRRN